MSDSAAYLDELHQNLVDHFNWSEIECLCLRLNIDYEIAPGTEKARWLRGILLALARNGRLPELIIIAQEERPNVTWSPVPDDFEPPTSPDSPATLPGTSTSIQIEHAEATVLAGSVDTGGGDFAGRDIDKSTTIVHQYITRQEKPDRFAGVPDFPRYGLIGRDQLLSTIVTRLTTVATGAQPTSLAISGTGGVGKTALAVALAYHKDTRAHFTDGVLWASVGPGGDPLLALGRWAEDLSLDPAQYPSPADLKRAVKDRIGNKQLLLVLDDIWQPDHAKMLRCGGPNCAHLLTTRKNNIARGFAGRESALDVRDLEEDPAFDLLHSIAPGPVAAAETLARDLLRQVGGLPLAVELLGGYLTQESDDEYALFADLDREDLAALNDPTLRLQQAKTKLEDTAGQKITLADLLALSLEDFSSEEKGHFDALGAFAPKPALFSREAAEAVSEAGGRFLRRLVNRNLLEVTGHSLAVHQLTADLARKRLQESEKLASARSCHAAYYLALANEDPNDWRRIDDAYEQIRWTWEHFDDDACLDWVWVMYQHQANRGLWNDMLEWHERGLAWASVSGLREDEAPLLNNLGWVYNATGRSAQALVLYERALPIRREVGDRNGEATTLNNMGGVYLATGRLVEALHLFKESLSISREVGDRAGEATTLNSMALVFDATGRPAQALRLFKEVLPIMRAVGDRAGEAATLNNMGGVYRATGRSAQALDLYKQALSITREVGHRAGEATTLNNMALVFDATGRQEEALALYEQALRIDREVGDRTGEATTLNNMAGVYRVTGRPAQALALYEQALPIRREVGHRAGEATTLRNLATQLLILERIPEAIDRLQEATRLFRMGLTHDASGGSVEGYEQLLQRLQGAMGKG